jgi:hypothetical protein
LHLQDSSINEKEVLEKVWDPKQESANSPIWQSNWQIRLSRFGQTFDVFKK